MIAQSLLGWADEVTAQLDADAQDFFWNHMNPNTCKAESLDWAARFCGFDGNFWDSSWTEQQKRDLIYYFRQLWQFRGHPNTLQFLFDLFELDARIKPNNGWTLGGERPVDPLLPSEPTTTVVGTAFPIRLGGSPFQMYISIPPRYQPATPERKLVERLRKLWLANCIEITYQYRSSN